MKLTLVIWSLVLGHCLAGQFFFGKQGVLSQSSTDSFNELTPTGGLFVYDASQESFANNDAVTTLTDKYGAGVDVTQGTSSKRPVFKTNIQNGLPAVLFDGVDDFLSTASAYGNNLSSLTVFAVVQSSDIFATFVANQIGWVFAPGWGLWHDNGTYGTVTVNTSGTGYVRVGGGAVDTSWKILMLTYDGSTVTVRRNKNASLGTGSITGSIPSGTSYLTLGSWATGGYPLSGYIGEVIGYNWVFDSTTEDQMWTYLATKWGITLTP